MLTRDLLLVLHVSVDDNKVTGLLNDYKREHGGLILKSLCTRFPPVQRSIVLWKVILKFCLFWSTLSGSDMLSWSACVILSDAIILPAFHEFNSSSHLKDPTWSVSMGWTLFHIHMSAGFFQMCCQYRHLHPFSINGQFRNFGISLF